MDTSVNASNHDVSGSADIASDTDPKFVVCLSRSESSSVHAGNGCFLHCIQMDRSVNSANQVVSVGADIAFDTDPKFFACLVRFESSSVPTTLPTAYDFFFFNGRHDPRYYPFYPTVPFSV